MCKKKWIQSLFMIFFISSLGFSQNENSFLEKFLLGNELKKENIIDDYKNYDFSDLILYNKGPIFGTVGEHKKRIRIKLISVIKDEKSPTGYFVFGKSCVRDTIKKFQGKIRIRFIRELENYRYDEDGVWKSKGTKIQAVLIGDYLFYEDFDKDSGKFSGKFYSKWFLRSEDKVEYNFLEMLSEGYFNNAFIGNWSEYDSVATVQCSWADVLPPNAGDLNIGKLGFIPNHKYADMGWQSLIDARNRGGGIIYEEGENWWKECD